MDKITVNILNEHGTREISVSWPTDEQWIKRQRARRILIKQLGRGASETDVVGGADIDLNLIQEISGEDGFSSDDAGMVLNQLSSAAVENVTRDGAMFLVRLRTCKGAMEFKLKTPSAKQIMDYRRAFVRLIDLPYGQQEIRTNLQAAAELFDALCEAKQTPIIWKTPVIAAIATELDRMLEPSREDF